MVPWAAVVPLCCFPFTFEAPTGEPPFQQYQVYVSTFENTKARGPASVGLAGPAGAGQHGTSGPGVLAQHSKVRSAVLTWQLAMLA